MVKDDGAFLTIGELARDLGVAQHILRYWETRFPQLRPLQRSGNRRYYRPADVDLARRIHRLLNEQGFTVKGAQRALEDRTAPNGADAADASTTPPSDNGETLPSKRAKGVSGRAAPQAALSQGALLPQGEDENIRNASDAIPAQIDALIARLTIIREVLEQALNP